MGWAAALLLGCPMDDMQLRGLIWTALKREGLDVRPVGYRDRPDVRGLVVQVEGREFIIVVGELREPAGEGELLDAGQEPG